MRGATEHRKHSTPEPTCSLRLFSDTWFSNCRHSLGIIPLSGRLFLPEEYFLNVHPLSTNPVSSPLSISEARAQLSSSALSFFFEIFEVPRLLYSKLLSALSVFCGCCLDILIANLLKMKSCVSSRQ